MGPTSHVRRYVSLLKHNQLFTTRDLLACGKRAAIDQVLYRMVKLEIIIRLARGVFMKRGSSMPTPYEIAKTKAEALGKKIFRHCSELTDILRGYLTGADWVPFGVTKIPAAELSSNAASAGTAGSELIFAISGCSSSFRLGDVTIKFKCISKRKLVTGESRAGIVMRSLWHLGNNPLSPKECFRAIDTLDRIDTLELIKNKRYLPAWLNDQYFSRQPFIPLMKSVDAKPIQLVTL